MTHKGLRGVSTTIFGVSMILTEQKQITDKITAAATESGMGLKALEKFEEPYPISIQLYNQLPARHRVTYQGHRMIFVGGLGWRRAILKK